MEGLKKIVLKKVKVYLIYLAVTSSQEFSGDNEPEWALLVVPASSVRAREGAGCGSVGAVSGA